MGQGGQESVSFAQFEGDVESGADFLRGVLDPCSPAIGERDDRVLPGADFREAEDAAPAIIVEELHGNLAPFSRILPANLEKGGYVIVTILEDVRRDNKGVACLALDGIAAAIDRRLHGLDDDASRRICSFE